VCLCVLDEGRVTYSRQRVNSSQMRALRYTLHDYK
jgi:hypothetical protein